MTSQTNFLGQARKDLQANFPQLVIKNINFAGEGMDSQALLVNDDLIFRFPKREEVVGQLKAEIRLLPKLRPLVPFEIPNFEYIGQQ
jgi:aminoglycoside 2''-phosphotransferase